MPPDDERFRVLCDDGAEYVARTRNELDVLLVDGFDADGQPPELCFEKFYRGCWSALTPSGVMVLNLCDHGNQTNFSRIKRVFDDQALIVTPDDGGNRVVFACKGRSRWQEEHAGSILMKIKEFEYRGTL